MFRIGEYKNDFYFPHSITEAHLQHTPAQVFFLKMYIVFICGLTQETFLILNIFPWYTPTIQIGSVFLGEVYKQLKGQYLKIKNFFLLWERLFLALLN